MTHFYHPEDRETIELVSGVLARTFWGDNLMLAVVNLEANAIVPEHSHAHEQGGIVISGEMTFTIAGESRYLKPGDVYMIPGDVPHSVTVGDAPARILDVFTPVREELKY